MPFVFLALCIGVATVFARTEAVAIASSQARGLLFPGDEGAKTLHLDHLLRRPSRALMEWPVSLEERCKNPDLKHAELCTGTVRGWNGLLKVEPSFHPVSRSHPLDTGTFEYFGQPGSAWQSLGVPAHRTLGWWEMPPVLRLATGYRWEHNLEIFFRFDLRRDLAAWHADPTGHNIPLGPQELDINEPRLGYLHWSPGPAELMLGRFPVHWGPSPDLSVNLSGAVAYHDGASLKLQMNKVAYHFLVSSLNPFLSGTPESIGGEPPEGSEWYRQRHYSSLYSNAHRRSFTERSKTLFAHRLSGGGRLVEMGITEMVVVGGKSPSLRDGSPFIFFHNNYGSGYSKNSVSLDGRLRFPAGISPLAELRIDDINYSASETENDAPTTLGWLLGLEHAIEWKGMSLLHGLFWVRTHPYLYNSFMPLTRHSSRRVLRSNYYGFDDDPFADTFVLDQPLGYFRGPDADDIWYHFQAWGDRGWALTAGLGYLRKGETNLATPYETYLEREKKAPSGIVEEIVSMKLSISYWLGNAIQLSLGVAGERIENEHNRPDANALRGQMLGSAAWRFLW